MPDTKPRELNNNMPSDAFKELLSGAWQRDHALIVILSRLHAPSGPGLQPPLEETDPLALNRLACHIETADYWFHDQINLVSRRNHMRALPYEYICNVCGKEDCPAAAIAVPTSQPGVF